MNLVAAPTQETGALASRILLDPLRGKVSVIRGRPKAGRPPTSPAPFDVDDLLLTDMTSQLKRGTLGTPVSREDGVVGVAKKQDEA